jgi:hypothetical protein
MNRRPVRGQLTLWAVLLVLLPTALCRAENELYHQTLTQDNRKLQLYISAEFQPAQQQALVTWIDFLSTALLQVYGRWPRQEWSISISPVSAAHDDPIPWAQVKRNAVDSVEFYTAPNASSDTLKEAWTGYHELAHLLIPYQGWGDTWFSEGLASYYQNILQARSGMLSEEETWQKIYEGFLRGRADTQFNGQSLEEISRNMRKDGGFMRVYWSGAWYFLATDVRLRQQSSGKKSLDQALERLNQCCAEKQLSVPQMVDKLDQLNRVLLFQPLYEQLIHSTEMPAFEDIFASLGISIIAGKVHLQQQGPGALLRQQILQPIVQPIVQPKPL